MTEPAQIIEESDSEITIVWPDGSETRYSATGLRRKCPCAGCIDEWTGKKLLADDDIPDGLTFDQISIVGRYALNFHFSDGHDTGIFSFQYMRGLNEGD
ncbi:DUF971 domain-containing protein [Leptolyngbya sp. 7M]|uniref:DUF971 domain-containing protein n=1 Tax=Leptolyngbya sp. 7M TaxID=2812896 RepID=UPI001B8CDE02|nr:DUF971 domain-containing protein [Leptolyngbya sp. 7M]QYO68108.1 DUF971 domain-containing protein [Leptolyngbya sp. 7M]